MTRRFILMGRTDPHFVRTSRHRRHCVHDCARIACVTSSETASVFVRNLNIGGTDTGSHRLEASDGVWTSIEAAESPSVGDIVVHADTAMPGLVDMHGHFGAGPYAVQMDVPLAHGTTTLCSQGDAGIGNFHEWRDACRHHAFRPLMAVNIGPDGERLTNCLGDVTDDFADRIVDLTRQHHEDIRLVAVNLSERSLGPADPKRMFDIALDAADRSGLPLMLALAPDHVLPIAVQLSALRAGDVVTYCYRSHPWCLFPPEGPNYEVRSALERGVLLDVAHGSEAFDEDIARRAVSHGYPPHIISSGTKTAELGHRRPLPIARVMQRMAQAGMDIPSVLRAVTSIPSSVLGLTDGSGTIRLGGRADMTALDTSGPHWTARAVMANGFPLI